MHWILILNKNINAVRHLSPTVKTVTHPWRKHLSNVQDVRECERLPVCSQFQTLMRLLSIQTNSPETVSDSLCWNSVVMQTDCCSSCSGGWSQTITEVNRPDADVLGWRGCTGSVVVRPVGCTTKFSETPLQTAYGKEMKIQFTGKGSGGHSSGQRADCTHPQSLRHLWQRAVWSNCTFQSGLELQPVPVQHSCHLISISACPFCEVGCLSWQRRNVLQNSFTQICEQYLRETGLLWLL